MKIDRSFVTKMGARGENSEIVRSIISLAQDLRMEAIAEGVETAHQVRQLRALGCHHGQGNFLAPVQEAGRAGLMFANAWRARVA